MADAKETIPLSRIDDYLRAVFTYLKKVGGRARPKDIFSAIAPGLSLSEHERSLNKSGVVRWENNTRFYKIDCTKAGFLLSDDGYWVLTPKGEEALSLPKGQLVRTAQELYRKWKQAKGEGQPPPAGPVPPTPPPEVEEKERVLVYEQAVESARTQIEDHVNALSPYEFQDLVAELLRAMGYHIRHVSPPGGKGTDVLAYSDPIGAKLPRIRAEVRHREVAVDINAVKALEGGLRKDEDIGLFVSSSGFTKDALQHAVSSQKHIETMDLPRLVSLWQEHYPKIGEVGRALLPLRTVHFLAPPEE
jgi:restriction system protein